MWPDAPVSGTTAENNEDHDGNNKYGCIILKHCSMSVSRSYIPTYLDIADITLPIRTELSEYLSPPTKACGNNEHEEDSVDRSGSSMLFLYFDSTWRP